MTTPQNSLYVGTSGWAYSIWKPDFYPKDLAAKNFLKYYSTQLNAVEVNYTFRRILSEKAALAWLADVPPDFQFVPKANYYITHIRRLKDIAEPLERFFPTLEPVRKRKQLGPVLFQLPPNFKADVPLLRDFLAQLPRNLRFAVEFRHESWFTDATYRTLERKKAALCVAETDTITTPEERTAKFIYFRFRRPVTSRATARFSPIALSAASPTDWRSTRSSSTKKIRAARSTPWSYSRRCGSGSLRVDIASVRSPGGWSTKICFFATHHLQSIFAMIIDTC